MKKQLLTKYRKCQHEEVHQEDVPSRKVEVAPSPKIEASKDHDMIEPQELPIMNIYPKIKHAWVREIIQEA